MSRVREMTADEKAELDALWKERIISERKRLEARAAAGLDTEPEGEEHRQLCPDRGVRREGKSTGIAMNFVKLLYGDTDFGLADSSSIVAVPKPLTKNARKRLARKGFVIIEDYQP